MKKINYFLIITTLSVFLYSFSQIDRKYEYPQNENLTAANNILSGDYREMNANNIRTWFRNNGSFNRDPVTGNSGFEWPQGSNKFARYASGLWIGAKVGGDTLICMAEYVYEYLPGNIPVLGGVPVGSTDPIFRIYQISPYDSSMYPDWRTYAAPQGAYLDSMGNPYLMGAQTQFYSYTDGYPEAHGSNAGSTAPLKAVILQTNWSYINVNMQDVLFTEFRIINRNNVPWNSAYISIWTDDDLGQATDDAVGIDTILNLGYTYNYDDNDGIYGIGPPAVGFVALRNPVVPSAGDTAKYYSPPGSSNLIVKPGYKVVKLSSFNVYTNSTGDPGYYTETYRTLQGFKRDGSSWINWENQQPSKFPFPGDPVTATGWIDNSPGDRRCMMTFGPLTMNPNDTQSIIVAQIISGGTSNLNSISNLRSSANYVRGIYNTNFQSVISVKNISTEVPDGFSLSQNYPNPFNPSTIINYTIPSDVKGQTSNVKLTVYNLLGKEVANLVNEKQSAGTYQVEFDAREARQGSGLASGVYFYRIEAGKFVETKRMMLVK